LDRVDLAKTEKVSLEIPVNLMRVLRAQAILQDMTAEDLLLEWLHDMATSWLDSDWPQEMFEQAYSGKSRDEREKKEMAAQ
jgi:hypothetical protein